MWRDKKKRPDSLSSSYTKRKGSSKRGFWREGSFSAQGGEEEAEILRQSISPEKDRPVWLAIEWTQRKKKDFLTEERERGKRSFECL